MTRRRGRPTPAAPTLLFSTEALAPLGVTRVGRVTGLDRTGVEVACAVRPGGWVLQVSQGKGRSWEDAQRSAVGEAAELWAAETPESDALHWASAEALAREGHTAWLPDGVAPGVERLVLPWVRAARLDVRGEAWVLAQSVYCAPPSAAELGLHVAPWTSNGLGAHGTRAGALRHATLERWERHLLSQALPDGWTLEAVGHRRRLPPEPLGGRLDAADFDVAVFELTPQGAPYALAGALLRDRRGSTHALTAGYACRERLEDALEAALLEAAQSRLTDIHGAREDIAHRGAAAHEAEPLFQLPVRHGSEQPRGRLSRAEAPRLAVVTLRRGESGWWVVKVVSPDLRLSTLL